MASITIYTQPFCGYCAAAKHLLKSKNQTWTEIDIGSDEKLREEMVKKSGRSSTPQIFINGKHIGGFDDLSALESKGKLDPLLK
jgi:glutaredoxin 3